jgi:hypothetical protein
MQEVARHLEFGAHAALQEGRGLLAELYALQLECRLHAGDAAGDVRGGGGAAGAGACAASAPAPHAHLNECARHLLARADASGEAAEERCAPGRMRAGRGGAVAVVLRHADRRRAARCRGHACDRRPTPRSPSRRAQCLSAAASVAGWDAGQELSAAVSRGRCGRRGCTRGGKGAAARPALLHCRTQGPHAHGLPPACAPAQAPTIADALERDTAWRQHLDQARRLRELVGQVSRGGLGSGRGARTQRGRCLWSPCTAWDPQPAAARRWRAAAS